MSIAADTPLDEVVRLIQAEAHSRYPVYRESLDDVIGMIHIKDVLAYWGTAKKFNLRDILRRVVFVAPTLPVLDMLLDQPADIGEQMIVAAAKRCRNAWQQHQRREIEA